MDENLLQNIKLENFEGALNHIIKLMNISEQEKLKRVEVLGALEKKVVRRLQSGKTEEAIEELRDIIDEYERLDLTHRAHILELTLNEYIAETTPSSVVVEEPPTVEGEDDTQAVIQVLEFRSKKVIRRFLQGKTDDAVEEMLEIIEAFRHLGLIERAQAIEDWMYEFLEKKLEEHEKSLPLSERLEIDPELEEQLLSFRTQKIIKRFAQGKPRRAVEEFTEIVNEYKRLGRLDVVEMLELWFNLFITKMFLKKPEVKKTQVPPPFPLSKPQEASPASPTVKFKEKITKIKSLLKKFEESL
ncbi:MAG: hypothetical protein HWN66_21680 [Candidatus Helarchaeota archaeon]|nr:hypothetical protein [Candidatus Helarchaeota archaeon]